MSFIDPNDMMLGLLIQDNKDLDNYGGYTTLRIEIRPVRYFYEDGEIRVRNISDSQWSAKHTDLADLVIEGIGWDNMGTRISTWSVFYSRPYDVKLERAEGMAKRLRKIQKTLDKISAEYGEPESLSQYALRVAKALRCDTFIRKVSSRDNWEHDGNTYKAMSPSSAQYHLQAIESDFYKAQTGAAS